MRLGTLVDVRHVGISVTVREVVNELCIVDLLSVYFNYARWCSV